MGETIRQVQGELKLLAQGNAKVQKVEIWALNSLVNRNNWQYVNLKSHLNEFKDIPILTAYLPTGKIGDGHNFNEKIDPETGEKYVSFTAPDAERIVGWISKDSNIRLEMKDGVEWIVAEANLWAWYSKELVDKILRQGQMSVSIETLILEEHYEGEVAVEEKYVVLGVTVLGDDVAPAVADAAIKSLAMLKECRTAMSEEVLKAASYIGEIENEPGHPIAETNKAKLNNTKGVKAKMIYSKKQLEELAPLFGGFRVLGAVKDDNGIHVALLSAEGATAIYTMGSLAEAIVPEKIEKVNAQATFEFSEDCNLAVNASDFLDGEVSELKSANAELTAKLDSATKDLEKANATIKAMETAENKRRVQACKDTASAVLNEYNATSSVKVDEKVLEAINADIDNGMYSESVNANGEWTGEAQVRQRVMSECAEAVMSANKANAASAKKVFAWDNIQKPNADDGSVEGLLSAMSKK